MTILDRRAARVVLVDQAGRTLLLRGGDPARPGLRWWFTPGGGLNDGETSAQGAARELFEETGLRVEPGALGEPVWHQITHFSYDNRQYRQEQDFYLVRVPEWQIDTAGFDAEEQLTIDAHRWWSPEELDATDETVFPENLADLLRAFAEPIGDASPSTFGRGDGDGWSNSRSESVSRPGGPSTAPSESVSRRGGASAAASKFESRPGGPSAAPSAFASRSGGASVAPSVSASQPGGASAAPSVSASQPGGASAAPSASAPRPGGAGTSEGVSRC